MTGFDITSRFLKSLKPPSLRTAFAHESHFFCKWLTTGSTHLPCEASVFSRRPAVAGHHTQTLRFCGITPWCLSPPTPRESLMSTFLTPFTNSRKLSGAVRAGADLLVGRCLAGDLAFWGVPWDWVGVWLMGVCWGVMGIPEYFGRELGTFC